jgi:hypothetical protein
MGRPPIGTSDALSPASYQRARIFRLPTSVITQGTVHLCRSPDGVRGDYSRSRAIAAFHLTSM